MRFIAKLRDTSLLLRLAQTVEKIEKTVSVHLTPKKIQLIYVSSELQLWSGMNAASLFDDYVVESKNNNNISFNINLSHLIRALKSVVLAQDIQMKLTKKASVPYLTLSANVMPTKAILVTQDVPVEVLPRDWMEGMQEPVLPDPQVSIMMPPLKKMKVVIERMKNICDVLQIQANLAGEMTLKVQTDLAVISTFYRKLEHPQMDGRDPPGIADTVATAKVDIKKFNKVLTSHQVNPSNAICCIVEGSALVLHVLLDDLYLTYYMPLIIQ